MKISRLSANTIEYILMTIVDINNRKASGHQRLQHIIDQLEHHGLVKQKEEDKEIFYF